MTKKKCHWTASDVLMEEKKMAEEEKMAYEKMAYEKMAKESGSVLRLRGGAPLQGQVHAY